MAKTTILRMGPRPDFMVPRPKLADYAVKTESKGKATFTPKGGLTPVQMHQKMRADHRKAVNAARVKAGLEPRPDLAGGKALDKIEKPARKR